MRDPDSTTFENAVQATTKRVDFDVDILAASINEAGERLTTFLLTYPRFIHGEFLTHRIFTRNSMSSRAMPIRKMIDEVMECPVIPIHWGAAQRGMQAYSEVIFSKRVASEREWLKARDYAVEQAEKLSSLGLHKQVVNRILEPFQWIRTVCSTTSFEHFRSLRCHPDAEPHFQKLANMMAKAYDQVEPTLIKTGEGWHLPFVQSGDDELLAERAKVNVSTARCGRVSYCTHDGRRSISDDLQLHDRLLRDCHWSPFGHPAVPAPGEQHANYRGWKPYRSFFSNEFIREPIVARKVEQ